MRRRIFSVAAWLAIGPALVVATGMTAGAPAVVPADAQFPGCLPPPAAGSQLQVQTGVVVCQELTDSAHLLGTGIAVPFEYYVPPACTSATPCPVLYLLHGFGGTYNEMLGTPAGNGMSGCNTLSAWIEAETSAPPAGFQGAPWDYACPSTWNAVPAADDLDMILVAPIGRILPGGYGPQPPAGSEFGTDSYWVNWNPRYTSRYGTAAPQFATFVTTELPAFVQQYFPTRSGRNYQAVAGVSLGGYGAYDLGLQHPDLYGAVLSVSGAMNFLFAPAPQPGFITLPVGVEPPVPVTYEQVPPATGEVVGPVGQLPVPEVGSFTTALTAFGDPAADQAYFRGNMPPDLALNGRAFTDGEQLTAFDDFWNDMVPEQAASQAGGGQVPPPALSNDVGSEPFENIVFPMNIDMEAAFAQQGVANTWAIHQGNHADQYRNAWFRGLEEFAYAHLAHPDGAGATDSPPTSFDYRTISTAFTIWGWHLSASPVPPTAQQPVEFLTLRDVTCRSLTLQGSGTVQVTVPGRCASGVDGEPTFSVNLGNSEATDEPADASATGAYGRTVTVDLSPLG